MKINVISKNQNVIGFASSLVAAGYEVQAVNQIEPCDILIYDVDFKKDIPKTGIINPDQGKLMKVRCGKA